MNRRDAIDHVLGLEESVASEFYVGAAEHDAGLRKTLDALNAFGVTDEEALEPASMQRESAGS